jgi:signal transduction histidine kinase
MRSPRDLTIREKSAYALVSATGLGLLVAVVALLVWDAATVRPRSLSEALGLSELLERHLEAALAFDDPEEAQRSLRALRSETDVVLACAYRRSGRLFASYAQTRNGTCPARLASKGEQRYEHGGWNVVEPIQQQDETVGFLYLRVKKMALRSRLVSLMPVVGVVAIALTAVSLWLSTLLGRVISRPLLALAQAASRVSDRHDYDVRLPVEGQDEVGQVTEAFNHMLARVRERESALARANIELQSQMAERQKVEAERERLLHDLRVALQVRDEFISVASHELRTPISTLLLQAGTLQRLARKGSELSPEALSSKAAAIARQGERLERLVGTLLDVSRIMAGKLVLTPEETDFVSVVEETIDNLKDEGTGVRPVVRLDGRGPIVGSWDRLRLEQVITNLIGNAIKYGEGKPVDVHIDERGSDRVTMMVRDRGMGIAPEHIGRIFGRFERAVSERHYGGLGLGLWIVRQIVDAMRGTILVESAPGRGSTFVVELPRRTPDEQARDGG